MSRGAAEGVSSTSDRHFFIPMPDAWFKRLADRVPKHTRVTFLSACVFGFLTHMFVFTNKLPNHDDIGHLFSDTYGTASGRWLLPYVLQLDGDFSLPWLIGALSIIALAVAACTAVSVLRIRSCTGCALTSAVMVTFPAVTATFSYMFTSSAYFLALALACLAALVTVRRRLGFIAGALLTALSLGIYQSYISAAASLMTGALILQTLDGDKYKKLLISALKYAAALGAGIAIYFVLVKITSRSTGLVDYMGISDMGRLDVRALPSQLAEAYKSYFDFFLRNNIGAHFGFLRYMFALTGLATIFLAVYALRVGKAGFLRALLFFALAALYPLAANIIYVMGPSRVHILMVYGMCTLLLAPVALIDYVAPAMRVQAGNFRHALRALCCWIVSACIALAAYSYCIYDNKAYLKLELAYEQSYAYSVRLISAVERTEGYVPGMPVVLIGSAAASAGPDPTPQLDEVDLTGILDMEALLTSYTYGYFLKYYVGYGGYVYPSMSDVSKRLEMKDEVKQMPVYPAPGSSAVVEKYLVIRLGG